MRVGNVLYLDHQATTPTDPKVIERMLPFFTQDFGNPHSFEHAMGWKAAKAVEDAATDIANLIGADTDEVLFTSGATEANNLAILGLVMGNKDPLKKKMLVSAIEHKSVLAAAEYANLSYNLEIITVPVDREGRVVLSALEGLVDDGVLLVSIAAVNNEIGTIQDVMKIGQICKTSGAAFHCDAAQWFCGSQIDVYRDNIDLLSLSGHKIYGPKGVGALFVSRPLQRHIVPLLHGGGQQHGLRAGTLPVPLCVGMGEAARLMSFGGERERLSALRDSFVEGVIAACEGASLNGPDISQRHPGNANITFAGCSAHDMLASLQPGLAASSGSACTSGIPGASYVLRAIGLSENQANASIRFSLGRFTTREDVDAAIGLVLEAYTKCTGFSPGAS